MRTEKEILKDIVDHVNKHSMITWVNKFIDEANSLYEHQSEQLHKPVRHSLIDYEKESNGNIRTQRSTTARNIEIAGN